MPEGFLQKRTVTTQERKSVQLYWAPRKNLPQTPYKNKKGGGRRLEPKGEIPNVCNSSEMAGIVSVQVRFRSSKDQELEEVSGLEES